MNNSLVSIIVPVYKAEKYIHQCIDSLLAQTYTDIEVILVDDGSPDHCGKICDEYAAKDSRVKVIHQQNGGVSAARNVGLANATGEWITFVDADDSVTCAYIEQLYANDSDWVIGGYRNTKNLCCLLVEGKYEGKDRLPQFFQEHIHQLYTNFIASKLYKKSIIDNYQIAFNTNIRFSEDFIFNLRYLYFCFAVTLKAKANYIVTVNSCVEEKYNLNFNEIILILDQIKECVELLSEKWNAQLSCDKSIRVNVAMYPLQRVFLDSREYEYLYAHYVIGGDLKDYYGQYYSDPICSPVIRGIRLVKMYVKSGQYVKALQMMRKVKKTYGKIIPSIHFSRYDKVVALLCRCFF